MDIKDIKDKIADICFNKGRDAAIAWCKKQGYAESWIQMNVPYVHLKRDDFDWHRSVSDKIARDGQSAKL